MRLLRLPCPQPQPSWLGAGPRPRPWSPRPGLLQLLIHVPAGLCACGLASLFSGLLPPKHSAPGLTRRPWTRLRGPTFLLFVGSMPKPDSLRHQELTSSGAVWTCSPRPPSVALASSPVAAEARHGAGRAQNWGELDSVLSSRLSQSRPMLGLHSWALLCPRTVLCSHSSSWVAAYSTPAPRALLSCFLIRSKCDVLENK